MRDGHARSAAQPLCSVLALRSRASFTVLERTTFLVFVIHVFQSLENETVRSVALPLVSLPLWHSLSPGRLQLELAALPQVEKHWRSLLRRESKAAQQEGHVPVSQQPQVAFLPSLINDFLAELGEAVDASGVACALKAAYCEARARARLSHTAPASDAIGSQRFIELLVDLLSQLPTRRFVRTLLEDRGLAVKCKLSRLAAHPSGRCFGQLLDMYRFYLGFEIDDHTGASLSDEDMMTAHYDRLQRLQRLAFKHVPELRELALSHCAAIEKRPALLRHLQSLSSDKLAHLAVGQLRLASPDDPCVADPCFLLELVVSTFERRRSQRQSIAEMPLYPNEEVLWNENVVPSVAFTGDSCLALPKLNLQFLTLHDYLLRNFNLFRLEATHEIQEDLTDVLARVAPAPHPDGGGRVVFGGWARMAVPPVSVRIVEVCKPKVGEAKPAGVTAEIQIDLASLRPDIRAEWDELRQHDILFLLARTRPPAYAFARGLTRLRARRVSSHRLSVPAGRG
jgi:intron-binding protein aquarius